MSKLVSEDFVDPLRRSGSMSSKKYFKDKTIDSICDEISEETGLSRARVNHYVNTYFFWQRKAFLNRKAMEYVLPGFAIFKVSTRARGLTNTLYKRISLYLFTRSSHNIKLLAKILYRLGKYDPYMFKMRKRLADSISQYSVDIAIDSGITQLKQMYCGMAYRYKRDGKIHKGWNVPYMLFLNTVDLKKFYAALRKATNQIDINN